MENKEAMSGEYTIDLMRLLKVLWRKAWIIVICAIITGAIGYSRAAFMIEPTYSSTIKLYTNNSDLSFGGTSISLTSGDISASRSLVTTYGEILNSRTTLEQIIKKAEIKYTYKQLAGMLKYGSSSDTEIMYVTVTSTDPYEASKIANCISEVLPQRVSDIMKGASMVVVDSAIPIFEKVNPSISKNTVLGAMIGFILCAMVIVVIDILDDTIHDEEHILSTYDYPILAKIPDLMSRGSQKYGYYYKSSDNSDN